MFLEEIVSFYSVGELLRPHRECDIAYWLKALIQKPDPNCMSVLPLESDKCQME